jgi:hypothetical protein
MRFARLIATLLVGCTSLTACAEETRRPLEITARPVSFALDNEGPKAVGQLAHLGSLRLTSPDSDFGGISGLIVSPDGKAFLAITDASHWLTGKLTYTDGRLTGMTGQEIAPLRDLSGKPLQGKAGDAEGLAGSLDGDVYVSFEGDHRIWKYAFGKDGLDATPVAVKVPADLAKAPGNGGLEAITLLADGKLLAITESYENADGDIRGWLIDPAGKAPASLALKRRAPYDVTDARQLENGDVLTLERRFNRVGGVGFAVRRIKADALKAGAPIEAEVIADAGMNFLIDNMEGLSIRKTADGRTLVYMISDNNFNKPIQQNLIMLFELKKAD